MTIEQLYDQAIKPLPATDRLRLATMILNEIPSPPSELPIPAHPITPSKRPPGEILAEIAAMARSDGEPTQDGRGHDEILYGPAGAR
jgi:hypothetical protein